MDAEYERVWRMFGALSDALWRRATQPGVSIIDTLLEENDAPVGEEEEEMWNQLTDPQNCASLLRYIENSKRAGADPHTSRLYDAVLSRAKCRWEATAKSVAT
jgi:hypothetical protein